MISGNTSIFITKKEEEKEIKRRKRRGKWRRKSRKRRRKRRWRGEGPRREKTMFGYMPWLNTEWMCFLTFCVLHMSDLSVKEWKIQINKEEMMWRKGNVIAYKATNDLQLVKKFMGVKCYDQLLWFNYHSVQ